MSRVRIEVGDAYLPLFDGSLRDRFVLVEGPRGTAKTRSILTAILCRALAWPGSRWGLTRSTRTRLTGTVLETLEKQVFPAFGLDVPGGSGQANRVDYRLPGGSALVPFGLDDLQRGQSAEFAGIYLAEAVEIPLRETVESLAGSLRQAGMPWHQCIVDCNPGPPGFWLNQTAEAVDPSLRRVTSLADYQRLQAHNRAPTPHGHWKRIITRHQDNPGYFDVRKWCWTEPGRVYVTETLEQLTGTLRRRWLDGDWVASEGTVYPEFDDTRHVIPPFDVPETWPWYVGWDPGYDHPTAILWFAVSPNGTIYIADEIYRGGRSVAEHCESVHAKNAGRTILRYGGDPQHAFSSTAQSPRSIASQAKSCGITLTPWPRTAGNEESMVERVRDLLRVDKLKVFSTCQNTIREFQSWCYKRTAKGELPPGEDAFEDRNNDAMDALKGMIASGMTPSRITSTVLDRPRPTPKPTRHVRALPRL